MLAQAERRDPQRGRRDEDRRHLRALLQHPEERVPPARRQLRGGAPHPAAQPAGPRQAGWCRSRPVDASSQGAASTARRDLPRPLLPRPAQRRLRPAARADRRAARGRVPRDGAQRGEVVLLRRRRRPDVDGGEARHPDQHQPHRRGRRHRRRHDRDRLPLLPVMLSRRPHRRPGRRRPRARRSRSSTSPRCCSPPCDSRRPVLRSRSARSPERPRSPPPRSASTSPHVRRCVPTFRTSTIHSSSRAELLTPRRPGVTAWNVEQSRAGGQRS